MNKKVITRFLAATISAVMLSGVFTAGIVSPAIVVEAADNATTQALKNAFDPTFYANKYPDVKAACGTDSEALFNHFLQYGMNEGRMMNSNFDPKAYIDAYKDIRDYCNGDYTKAYEHYINNGIREGRTLTTYDAINQKKAAEEAAAAAAAAQAEAERQRQEAASRKTVYIGHGLSVTLNEDQYRRCEIAVLASGYGFGPVGYGAYIDDNLVASSYGYNENGAYPYSLIVVNNGYIRERMCDYYGPYYYDYDNPYYYDPDYPYYYNPDYPIFYGDYTNDENINYEDALALLLMMSAMGEGY